MTDTKRKLFTEKSVRALKPAALGKRYDVYDTLIPNLLVRVTSTGYKSFCLRSSEFPGKKGRVRRELGQVGVLTCDEARAKARRWLSALAEGVDPSLAERREQGRAVTFGAAVEQWLALCVRGKQRKAHDVEREVRGYLVPVWGNLPVADIQRTDVKQLITAIRDGGLKGKPAPYQAHNLLGHARTFFDWAVDQETFGLGANPAAGIKPAKLIGAKKHRQRVLTDDELRALWRAAEKMGFPYGSLFKMLLLTGSRNSEVREARWCEFDLAKNKRLWTIPPERFKSDSEHLVALSGDAVALLGELPRFQHGDCLFTASFGRKPVYGLSKAKERLDRLMLRTLRALARARGENPAEVSLPPFVVHDLRRTVRTRLASLRVPDEVAEMVLGHGRKGLQRVYDQHTYEAEMRDALERWAARLRSIVAPPSPDNIVPMRKATK